MIIVRSSMYLSIFETFIGFSETQSGFLIKEKQFGPEGGETLAFVLYNCHSNQTRRFLISDTLNRGNGRIIQHLSPDECCSVLTEMETSLSEWGFSGIHIQPDRCKARERERVITVTPRALDINKKGFFARDNDHLFLPPFFIMKEGTKLSLYKENSRLLTWIPGPGGWAPSPDPCQITDSSVSIDHPHQNGPDIQQMQAWKTPDNCLIVLFSFHQYNTHRIMDILYRGNSVEYTRLFPG